jgi:hypothetical protein
MSDREVALTDLRFWPRDFVEVLARHWITTADQVVALAATAGGKALLAQQLKIDEATLERYLRQTRAALPAARVRALEAPVDTSNWGLGARRPPEDDQN